MKKVIFAIIIAVIVFAFTFPIYADQPTLPGEMGVLISLQAQEGIMDYAQLSIIHIKPRLKLC